MDYNLSKIANRLNILAWILLILASLCWLISIPIPYLCWIFYKTFPFDLLLIATISLISLVLAFLAKKQNNNFKIGRIIISSIVLILVIVWYIIMTLYAGAVIRGTL